MSSSILLAPVLHPTVTHGRIFGLDLLRAAAIFSVVGAHGLHVFYPHIPHIGLLGHGGFFGVELFFVLSGYLIGRILLRVGDGLRDLAGLGTFYVRRWFRTLPLFWLFIGLNVGLEWHINQRTLPGGEVIEHALFLRTFASNRVGFIPESFSLAIEEWFYLLFPAALWLILRCRVQFTKGFLATVAVFYLFSTIGRVLSADHPGVDWSSWQRVLVIYRFDALMTGVLAAVVAQSFPVAWQRWKIPSFIAGFILAFAMYASLWTSDGVSLVAAPDSFFARTFRFNLVSLGFALLLPAASTWRLRQETFWTAGVQRIAVWSYSMYLVHQPVIKLVSRHLFQDWKTSEAQAFAVFSFEIVATILVSAVLYKFFEAPFTSLREKAAPARARQLSRTARV